MTTDAIGQAQTTGISEAALKSATGKTSGSGKSVSAGQAADSSTSGTSNAAMEAIAQQMQQALSASNTGLKFSVDSSTGKTIVKVVEEQTGEVIRQIPNEEMMAISRNIGKLQGLLFQKKA